MIASVGLVVGVVVLYEEWGVIGEGVNYSAAKLILTCGIVLDTLLIKSLLHGETRVSTVCFVKVALCVHTGHIVHCRGNSCLYACIYGSSIYSHSAPAADTKYAYAFGVNVFLK